MRLAQPRLQESKIVVKSIRERPCSSHFSTITAALEANAVTVNIVLDGTKPCPGLDATCVEWRIRVDEINGTGGQIA